MSYSRHERFVDVVQFFDKPIKILQGSIKEATCHFVESKESMSDLGPVFEQQLNYLGGSIGAQVDKMTLPEVKKMISQLPTPLQKTSLNTEKELRDYLKEILTKHQSQKK